MINNNENNICYNIGGDGMINLTRKDLEKYSVLKSDGYNTDSTIYIVDDHTLYKIFKDDYIFYDEKVRNIKFLLDKEIPYAITPEDIIVIDGKVWGYKMLYLKDSKTLRKGIQDIETSLEDKAMIIKKIYIALRGLHDLGIFLGDIHLDNFLYSNDSGFIIDLDDIRFLFEQHNNRSYYFVKTASDKNSLAIEDQYTDNLKAMIYSLSFLLNIDLETMVKKGNLMDSIRELNLPEDVELYISAVIDSGKEEILYFDDIVDFVVESLKQKER